MYNPKDIQFVGKHDYDKDNAMHENGWNKTFSIGIFKWELKSNGKEMKKSKSIVRVSGLLSLDNNEWDGRKTVKLKIEFFTGAQFFFLALP